MEKNIPLIRVSEFLMSCTSWKKLPEPTLPEYAVIGRSNVGKSSLINSLCNRRSLAKVSGTPGKTQCINIFQIENLWYLVDLPGYGYAKVSQTKRLEFKKFALEYLRNRPNLMLTFILIDSRLDPLPIDIDFVNNLGNSRIPLALVFTKADKNGINKSREKVKLFHQKLLETWDELPPTFLTSAKSGYGKDELLSFITETNQLFRPTSLIL